MSWKGRIVQPEGSREAPFSLSTYQMIGEGGTYHQRKRHKGKTGDGGAKHEHFTIGNQDDGQVFEDAVASALLLSAFPRCSDRILARYKMLSGVFPPFFLLCTLYYTDRSSL